MTFAADIAKFSNKAEKAVDKTVRAITFALFREVIMRTPVDQGALKANWRASVGTPVLGTITSTDKSGGVTVAAMAAGIGGWGSVTYLTNNMVYASRIEFDGWSHTKAPAGMIRPAFARIQRVVAQAARDNKV